MLQMRSLFVSVVIAVKKTIKLYLSCNGGEEIMFSNFDAEHGIPFHP